MNEVQGGAGAGPSPVPAPLAVFVVDDSSAFRRAACAVVAALPDFELAGAAASGLEAVRRLLRQGGAVDLVLLDVNLPDLQGPSVSDRVLRRWPELSIVFVSTLDRDDLPDDLLSGGATDFVSKSDFGPEVLERLGTVLVPRSTLRP